MLFTLIDIRSGGTLPPPTLADMVLLRFQRELRANPLWADATTESPDGVTTIQLQLLIQGEAPPSSLHLSFYEQAFERFIGRLRRSLLEPETT